MSELYALAMTAFGYTLLTLTVSAAGAGGALPFPLAPLLAFVFTHQAGWMLNVLTQYAALAGRARVAVPCGLLLPVLGLLRKARGGVVIAPTGLSGKSRAVADIVEAVFYVLIGSACFGWASVYGWPIALAGMMAAVLARPWVTLTF